MIDLHILFDFANQTPAFGEGDIVLTESNTTSTENKELESAVLISLFTDRRADKDDVIEGNYRGGWWADTHRDSKIGSRFWLLRREKLTETILPTIKQYITEALQWLIDDKVIVKIDVDVQREGLDRVYAAIALTRNDGTKQQIKFNNIWKQQ